MNRIFHKSRIYPIVLLLIVFIVWKYRQQNTKPEGFHIMGTTMGTIAYNVKYIDDKRINYKASIDSLLNIFNQALSTYIASSEISRFNKNSLLKFESPFLLPVLKTSKEVFEETKGAFDPTIMPLVNAWGFGPDTSSTPDSATVNNLRKLVDFNYIFFDSISICKLEEGVELDFSAIAKGYAVDIVTDFLLQKGIQNTFVEIGGEISVTGQSKENKPWVIGIEDPTKADSNRAIFTKMKLKNMSVATSGNYRNFRIEGDKKISHTINPLTGFPVEHTLLSVSVFSKSCMRADAYATAFMVIGLEKAKQILADHNDLEAFMIYSDPNGVLKTYMTEAIEPNIIYN